MDGTQWHSILTSHLSERYFKNTDNIKGKFNILLCIELTKLHRSDWQWTEDNLLMCDYVLCEMF